MKMQKSKLLSDLISTKLFLGPESASGFRAIKCACCNDHSPRGGFKFENNYVIYNCFNCGISLVHEEFSAKFNRNTKNILSAFGITEAELTDISNSIFFSSTIDDHEPEISLADLRKPNFATPEVALPNSCYLLGNDAHYDLQIPILEYLESRQIDPIKNKLMYSLDPNFLRRVIIPFWKDEKIIYWQARAIDRIKRRYLNCIISKEAVLYGYSELYRWSSAPLFVTEGVFDAMQVNGVSILGSVINQTKLQLLNKSKRRLVFVIDRDENGHKLGKFALDNNWEITFVDINADDINDSINKFGKLFTIYSLMKNISSKNINFEKLESRLNLDLHILDKKLRTNKWMR